MLHVSRFAQLTLWQFGQGQSPESNIKRTPGHAHNGQAQAHVKDAE